jgi:hypothetical protein
MMERCPECGAPLPDGGQCRDHFSALLLLEAQVPEAAGSLLHFYAVASYALQHPDSFGYTAPALADVCKSLADALDGQVTVEDLRRRARYGFDGPARVVRRAGDDPAPWHRGPWPVTVADVCTVDAAEYVEQLLRWAHAVRDTLDAYRPEPGGASPITTMTPGKNTHARQDRRSRR